MIKFLPLLLLFSLANAQPVHYLLPDQNQIFSHTLEHYLAHSHHDILVVTPAFNHSSIKHAIMEGLRRGSALTLIVHSAKGDPLQLAQYERVDLRIHDARPVIGSIIVIDDRFGCTIPGPLNSKQFSEDTLLISCTEDATEVISLRRSLSPLVKRSKPYLK